MTDRSEQDTSSAGPGEGADSPALRSAASHALEQVLGLIAHGALSPGAQLPPERDLSLQLGVSRSSIREATSAMVALGLLEARRGAGVFVTSLDTAHLLSSLSLTLAVAPHRTRVESAELAGSLEPMAAGFAAARADGQTVLHLEGLAGRSAVADDLEAWVEAEAAFHLACAQASGNAMLAGLLEATWQAGSSGEIMPDLMERSTADHRRLLAAIRARDPDRARMAAAAHGYADVLAYAESSTAPTLPAAPEVSRTTAAPVAAAAPALVTATRPVPSWWRDAKLGVFIHWGLYSVPGWAPLDDSLVELLTDDESVPRPDEEIDPIVRHCFSEWYENGAAIPGSPTWRHHREVYDGAPYGDFRGPFEQTLLTFDADDWVEQFARAGARYAVMVAKHHDGFLLWPAEYPNPRRDEWAAGRDVIGDVAAALRAHELKMGVYYSSGIDWTFGNMPIAHMKDVHTATPTDPDYATYVDAHWRELVSRYQPDILWNDMGYPDAGQVEGLLRDYYAAIPEGVVTDRFGASTYDVATPNYARRHTIDSRPWESVRPLGMSFGWNRQESASETLTGRELVHMLLDVVSKNGNLLLGVSPDAAGNIPDVQQRSLAQLGNWLTCNGRSVYGTRPWVAAEATTADGVPVRFTCSSDTLYLHLLTQTEASCTVLGLSLSEDATATHVADGSPVSLRRVRGGVRFDGLAVDPSATVIAISPLASARLETWRTPGLGHGA